MREDQEMDTYDAHLLKLIKESSDQGKSTEIAISIILSYVEHLQLNPEYTVSFQGEPV